MQKSISVNLYSGTGRLKQTIRIFPIKICGEYSDWRREAYQEGCAVDDHHAKAGGRYNLVFETPEGYEKMMLTRSEREGVEFQIQEMGKEVRDYLLPDTIHGSSKIRCNQGAVLVAKSEENCPFHMPVDSNGGYCEYCGNA